MVAITVLTVIIYAVSAVEFMENIEFRRVVTIPDVDATTVDIRPGPGSLPRQESSGRTVALIVLTR